VLCVALASAFFFQAQNYAMGRANAMGPGYFPSLLALVLAGVGAVLVIRSFYIEGARIAVLRLGPLAMLVTAIVLFGLLINWLGLVVAGALAALIGARAGPDFRIGEGIALSVALVAFSVIVFVYALGLPLKLWPGL
jgi:hypothetical protein